MSPLASPYLFGSLAIHTPEDPWIASGAHLHVHISAELDPPLHPFVAFPIRFAHRREMTPLDVSWFNERGEQFSPPFDLETSGPVTGTVTGSFGEPIRGRLCFMKLEGDDGLVVEWLDKTIHPWGTAVLGTRSRLPYAFGGYDLARLRVSGTGQVMEVSGIFEDEMFSDELGDPIVFGLPIEGSFFYATRPGSSPFDEARERLQIGQTRRLGPPDQPDGSFPPLVDGEDDARLHALAPGHIDPWLRSCYLGENLPSMEGVAGSTPFHVDLNPWSMILSMAADARLARYLGLATVVEPEDVQEGLPVAWLVACEFPVSGQVRRKYESAGQSFAPGGAIDQLITSKLHEIFPDLDQVRSEFSPQALEAMEWEFITLIALTVTASKAPPDPPAAPTLALAKPGSWNANTPSPSWTQTIVMLGQPSSGPVGYARFETQQFLSLHKQVEGFGAIPMLTQWSKQARGATAGFDPSIQTTAGGVVWTPPMLTDSKVPESDAGVDWRIWQSDRFGRWSDPADIHAALPERPAPPAPAPELHFTPQTAPEEGPASPGVITIRIDPPQPGVLPPGARTIAAVEILMDGSAIDRMALGAGQKTLSLEQAAPELLPGQTRTVVITSRFWDAGDRPSLDGTARLDIFDPRPVAANPTAPNLLWTGRLDATGQAELAITWPAPDPKIGYRVYLGGERRLAEALAIPETVLNGTDVTPAHRLHNTRALAADRICEAAASGRLRDRAVFTLLTEQPIKPDNGHVRFQFQLPGGLAGTQFLRIVPVTASGAEPPFESCGLVPIAVPKTEHPPAPTVQATMTPAGVQLRVLAYGLTPEILARFGYPGAGLAPEFRIRRTRGQVADPLYLPVVRQGALVPPPEGSPPDAPWIAELIEPAFSLPIFVTHTWFAEVCFPPEPARAKALEEQGPRAVLPLWGTAGASVHSPWSQVSLPVSFTPVPGSAPGTPARVGAERQPDGAIHLIVDHQINPHSKTIAPYRLAIWKWVLEAGVTHLLETPVMMPVAAGSVKETIVETATDVVAYSVAVIDPLGRMSGLTRADVVEASPRTTFMPNVLGRLLDDAFQFLREFGLSAVLIGDEPAHPETALVRSTEPPAGEPVEIGVTVVGIRARDEGEMNGPGE
jgi:hypothetical protein